VRVRTERAENERHGYMGAEIGRDHLSDLWQWPIFLRLRREVDNEIVLSIEERLDHVAYLVVLQLPRPIEVTHLRRVDRIKELNLVCGQQTRPSDQRPVIDELEHVGHI